MAHSISVVIVNFNAGDRLAKCLRHLQAQTLPPAEVIIFDNASSDDSVEQAKAVDPHAKVITSPENLGFAAGNNRAVEHCSGDWVAFLNPDAYAEPDWLEEIARAIDHYPGTDAFGSLQVDAADPQRLDGAGDAYFFAGLPYRSLFGKPRSGSEREGEVFAPCAAAAVYRRQTFVDLGGFEESFFCYAEDVDLGFRLRLAGGRAIQLNKAVVAHEGSGITGRRSPFTVYHGHRNRIWVHVRNMPLPLLLLSLPFHLLVNLYLVVRFTISGDLIPYLRGMRDAAKGLPAALRQRAKLQGDKTVSSGDLARTLTWSPWAVVQRTSPVIENTPTRAEP